jgi:hypothetical protein
VYVLRAIIMASLSQLYKYSKEEEYRQNRYYVLKFERKSEVENMATHQISMFVKRSVLGPKMSFFKTCLK